MDSRYLLKKSMSIVEKDEVNEEFVNSTEMLESWRTGHGMALMSGDRSDFQG